MESTDHKPQRDTTLLDRQIFFLAWAIATVSFAVLLYVGWLSTVLGSTAGHLVMRHGHHIFWLIQAVLFIGFYKLSDHRPVRAALIATGTCNLASWALMAAAGSVVCSSVGALWLHPVISHVTQPSVQADIFAALRSAKMRLNLGVGHHKPGVLIVASDSIRTHLRAALDEAVAQEKQRLHELYDKSDAAIAARIEMMRPLISSLKALELEIGKEEGVDIGPAPHGHMATVRLKSSTVHQTFSVSTSSDNASFEVEERTYYTFGDADTFEKRHSFTTADPALALVVEAVGKHIAQQRVLAERKK